MQNQIQIKQYVYINQEYTIKVQNYYKIFNKVIKIKSKFVIIQVQLAILIANIFKVSKNYVDAMSLYDKIIEMEPQFTKSYQQKAKIYSLDRSKKENDMYDKILVYHPRNIKIIIKKVIWYSKYQQYNDGLIFAEKLIELKPTDADVYYIKGLILEQQRRTDEAMKCYDIAIQWNPNDAYAYNYKGLLLKQQGRTDEAMKCSDRVIQLYPTYANAYDCKGFILEQEGRLAEAKQYYDKATQIYRNQKH